MGVALLCVLWLLCQGRNNTNRRVNRFVSDSNTVFGLPVGHPAPIHLHTDQHIAQRPPLLYLGERVTGEHKEASTERVPVKGRRPCMTL